MLSRRATTAVAVVLAGCLLLGGGLSYFANATSPAPGAAVPGSGTGRPVQDTASAGDAADGSPSDGGSSTDGIAGTVGLGLVLLGAAGLLAAARRRSDAARRERVRP